jgi:hypothetical protein
LKEIGHPDPLSISGNRTAALAVRDTAAHEKLIQLADRAERRNLGSVS